MTHAGMEHLKQVGDVASLGTVVASVAGYLPSIAALFTIIWTIMRITDEWPRFKWRMSRFFSGKEDHRREEDEERAEPNSVQKTK